MIDLNTTQLRILNIHVSKWSCLPSEMSVFFIIGTKLNAVYKSMEYITYMRAHMREGALSAGSVLRIQQVGAIVVLDHVTG